MIHRVTIKTSVDATTTVEHTFEHMPEDEDAAKEYGEEDALLTKAWSEGFSRADLT